MAPSASDPGIPSPVRRGRIVTIDVLRAIALIAMAIYHFAWDLDNFGYVTRGLATSGGWIVFARSIASSFLFLVGFSLILAHARGIRWKSFGIRLAEIVLAALAITLVTFFVTPDSFVFFGILQQIAVASILGLLFVRLPWALTAIVGIAIVALPFFYRSPAFDPVFVVWIGLNETAPGSNDFVPMFPFFGVVLLGIAAGRLAVDRDLLRYVRRIDPKLGPLRYLSVLGRHSLAFYLIHQPVLFGLVFVAAQLFPPDMNAAFSRDCRASCLATQSEGFCERYCSCTQAALTDADLLAAMMNGTIDASQERSVRDLVERCSFDSFMADQPAP